MDERREVRATGDLRASDSDRQAVTDRLTKALDEGRLNLHEWDERVAKAYRSATYGELALVCADLPDDGQSMPPQPAAAPVKRAKAEPSPGVISDLPLWMKILWLVWFTAVLINVVVWALVTMHSGHKVFWPIWVAGPPGAALFGLSAGVTMVKRTRRNNAAQRRLNVARRQSNR
jgi:hypothetical protein